MTEDLAPTGDEPSLELVSIKNTEALVAFLAGTLEAPEPSAEERAAARLNSIREMIFAETEDELWRETPTWSSKNAIDGLFRIMDCRALRSSIENENGVHGAFLSCRALNLDTGELGILNTSAARLCGRLGWYWLHDQFPVVVRVVKLGESSRGFPILDARKVEGYDDYEPNPANPLLEEEDVTDAELVAPVDSD